MNGFDGEERMKKNKIITIISVVLLICSLVASLFLTQSIGVRVANVVTIITAIIGAVALFVQFKQDKVLNRAGFLIEYNRNFYNDYQLGKLFDELERCRKEPDYVLDCKKWRKDIISYLEWCEIFASLVERNAIDLYTFDNIVAYRFFLITNNKYVQQEEIVPEKKFYRGLYYLYDIWYKYEKKRGIEIPMEETALCLTEGYEEYLAEVKSQLR